MASGPDYVPTSERVTVEAYLADESDYLIYLFHIASYDYASRFVDNGRVLDFGCGTGYGAHRIAARCTSIVGVDIAQDAVAYAQENFQASNLTFEQIEPVEDANLRFDDESFDVVLSFQVIEHIANPDQYISEVARVLAPGGVFVCATPDREHRLFPGQRPWNRFHVREHDSSELCAMLKQHFAEVEMNLMTAPKDVIDIEIRRSRRLKVLSAPFTFRGAPEWWRQGGLRALKRLKSRRAAQTESGVTPDAARSRFGFDESSISIGPAVQPSVNLVAVARRPRHVDPVH